MIEVPAGVFFKVQTLLKKVLDLSENRLKDLGNESLDYLSHLEGYYSI